MLQVHQFGADLGRDALCVAAGDVAEVVVGQLQDKGLAGDCPQTGGKIAPVKSCAEQLTALFEAVTRKSDWASCSFSMGPGKSHK